MSDLKQYVEQRKAEDLEFALDYDEGFAQFKLGVLLKEARESSGLTQQELAKLLHTQKTAISRLENHAEDIRLLTLIRFAHALGKRVELKFVSR